MTVAALRVVAPDQSDFALARQVAAGDLRAFEQIMRRHNRMLYRTARSILRDDTEAEDCLQSAYLLAYRAIASFAGHAKLSTWLARIVINEALARKRQTARRGVVVPIDGATDTDDLAQAGAFAAARVSQTPGPEHEAMRHELGVLIERRIDALPEVFRGVFVLRAIEELSVEETAALLDIPEATVRTRFFRARGLLRESLAQDVDTALDSAFAFAGARCDRIVAAVLDRLGPRLPPVPTG
ncbi:MAG TPA: RNA polymerase sigma factor [Burkholderiaceae bacterium]|nr:RNA polymerase sigma factor [Burkholderiaceae bacterium]